MGHAKRRRKRDNSGSRRTAMDWDDVVKPAKTAVALGEDLKTLSISELTARIALLQSEITRIETEITVKQQQSAAAEALFRK
jgi:uncharacterized small protein (DUF1192 family)